MDLDPIVCGLATGDRLQREGMAEDQRDAFLGAEDSHLVPGEPAFDDHDEDRARGRHNLEPQIGAGGHILMDHALAVPVQHAAV